MKKLIYILMTALAAVACGNSRNSNRTTPEEDMVEYGKIGYADIVSFIVQGYQCKWDGISPEDQGLSYIYSYGSEYAGFAEVDINGDGIDELLIGDQFEDGQYDLYDIYSINPADGSLYHLAKGGERDRFKVNGDGVITEYGSNSADDSFSKGYVIKDGKLEEVQEWHDSLLDIKLERFVDLAFPKQLVGAFGNQREIEDGEMDLFRKTLAEAGGEIVYTPLSVSTQVVAGINYKFYCRFEDKSDGIQRKSADDSDKYGYCWVTIYKPLPGQGDPKVTKVEKVN